MYKRQVIDELSHLWNDGLMTYDVSMRQNFLMKVALLWTVSDFPAYGMLYGWMTSGKLACPYCMEHTKSFILANANKQSLFDCHRQFLPMDHRFRRNKSAFYKNREEHSEPPPTLTGEQLWNRVSLLPRRGITKAKFQITENRIIGHDVASSGDFHNGASCAKLTL